MMMTMAMTMTMRGQGVAVAHDACQDTDDATKALAWVAAARPGAAVLVLGAFGGNVTQALANLNVLYAAPAACGAVVLASAANAVLALAPGRHAVRARRRYRCGLVPLGAPCAHAATRGLRWDVAGPLRYGGLVSSSNQMCAREVRVAVSSTVLWTFDLARPLEP